MVWESYHKEIKTPFIVVALLFDLLLCLCNNQTTLKREAIMPFPKQNVRIFNRTNIEALSPNQFGVYGLYKDNQWIYVGKGEIRQRLLDHHNGDNPCINREKPTYWVDEVTSNMDTREKELILELNPVCNKRVG